MTYVLFMTLPQTKSTAA